MKNQYKRIIRGVLTALIMPCLVACDLINVDFDSNTQRLTSFTFNYDTVYAMKGDTFFLSPYLYPDNGLSTSLYWETGNPDIVNCINDTIVAEGEGWTRIIATTLSNQLSDTCVVCIMRPWQTMTYGFPTDMAVYAHITVGGKLPGKNMVFCAYLPDAYGVYEPRALGQPLKEDRSLYLFRVWGDLTETDEDDPYYEPIIFRSYDRNSLQVKRFPQTVDFDGETAGIPSHPIELAM